MKTDITGTHTHMHTRLARSSWLTRYAPLMPM